MEQRDRMLKRAVLARARLDMEVWAKLLILSAETNTIRYSARK